MRSIENIVRLPQDSIFALITSYLDSINSHNTRISYERDIRRFFMYHCNKHIENLVRDDLNVTYAQMMAYRTFLDKNFASATVNSAIAAVKGLYKLFDRSVRDCVNTEGIGLLSSVSVKYLKAKPKSFGILYYDEYLLILEALEKQYKSKEKRLLFELAFHTSYRMNAVRTITWNSFVFDPKSDHYYVKTVDKGDKDTFNGIPNELYHRIYDALYNKHDELGKNAKVFNLQPSTINEALKRACDAVGIDHTARHITFHSIKKLGVNMTYEVTGDIRMASEQGRHSDINTTSKYYVDRTRPLSDMPLIQAGKPLDLSALEQMSKEELFALINNSDYLTKLKLLKSVKK